MYQYYFFNQRSIPNFGPVVCVFLLCSFQSAGVEGDVLWVLKWIYITVVTAFALITATVKNPLSLLLALSFVFFCLFLCLLCEPSVINSKYFTHIPVSSKSLWERHSAKKQSSRTVRLNLKWLYSLYSHALMATTSSAVYFQLWSVHRCLIPKCFFFV